MPSCPNCGAQLASEAAICEACEARRRSSRTAPPSASALGIVHSWSTAAPPLQKLTLIGGALAVIGSFLPFYAVNLPEGMGSAASMSFLNTGFPGVLTLVAAVALALIAFMPSPSRQVTLAGFGIATLVLGMFVYAFTGAGLEGANPAAAGLVSHGIGAYVLGIGALLLEYAYVQQVAK